VPRRKAYRLGKWLGDLNSVRKTPLSVRYSYLEILASGGEGVYYFFSVRLWLTCAPALELGRTRCDNALPRLPTWLHARAGGRGRVRDGAQGDVAPHAGRRQGAARVGRGRARRLQARRAP